jgi:DNA-directed RNA polymerase specialized sigma24 family protein
VIEQFDKAIQDAIELASGGHAWRALARLQQVDIESAVLRLTERDMRSTPRSEREQAVGHAVTKLYETWARGERVLSVMGFLKVVAVRKAIDLSRNRLGPDVELDNEFHDGSTGVDLADEPMEVRRRAVAIARGMLPELGLPSVIDCMTVFLDRVAAGDDASASAIATFLDMKYSTVTTQLSRGLKRLEDRISGRDLDVMLSAMEEANEDEEDWT